MLPKCKKNEELRSCIFCAMEEPIHIFDAMYTDSLIRFLIQPLRKGVHGLSARRIRSWGVEFVVHGRGTNLVINLQVGRKYRDRTQNSRRWGVVVFLTSRNGYISRNIPDSTSEFVIFEENRYIQTSCLSPCFRSVFFHERTNSTFGDVRI